MSFRDAVLTVVYVSTGVVWTGRSVLAVAANPDYWDPQTAVDWTAVWTYSLALLLLTATLLGIAAESRSNRVVRIIGGFAAAAALATGLANAIEDAFAVATAATVYVIGAVATAAAMVAFAVALGLSRRPRWVLVVLLLTAGMVTMSLGLGVLVLIGAGVALWARRSPGLPADVPDHSL